MLCRVLRDQRQRRLAGGGEADDLPALLLLLPLLLGADPAVRLIDADQERDRRRRHVGRPRQNSREVAVRAGLGGLGELGGPCGARVREADDTVLAAAG